MSLRNQIIFLFSLLFGLLIHTTTSQRVNMAMSRYLTNNTQCTEEYLEQTDHAVARLLGFGPFGRPFPENATQLKAYCDETTKVTQEIESFFRICYKRDIRDIANVMLYLLKRTFKQFCRRRSVQLNKILANTACINRHLISDDHCLVLFADNVKRLIEIPDMDDKLKIRYTCCFYLNSLKCSDDVLQGIPCIANNKDYILNFVQSIFSSYVGSFCPDISASRSRCYSLEPLPPSISSSSSPPDGKRYTTFLFVLLDLLESLKSFELPGSAEGGGNTIQTNNNRNQLFNF